MLHPPSLNRTGTSKENCAASFHGAMITGILRKVRGMEVQCEAEKVSCGSAANQHKLVERNAYASKKQLILSTVRTRTPRVTIK
jgi:hypothetical protein